MQVPDERADPVRRLLLRIADLLELLLQIHVVALVQKLARDIDLQAQPEEDLREVVVQIAGDLEPLVGTLLSHRVRQVPKDLGRLLEFDVRLLQRLGPEEHLPSEQERRQEDGK